MNQLNRSMGIEIEEYSSGEQIQRKVIRETKPIFPNHVQSGAYNLGRYDPAWSLDLVDERIKVLLKLYTTSLQTRILDRINPTTAFKNAWGYGRLDIELRAVFDNKQLLLNGSIHASKDFRYEQHIKYHNVIISSW